MRGISLPLMIGILVLLVIPQSSVLVPMESSIGSGNVLLPAYESRAAGFECVSGQIVVVQFSASRAEFEFFLVHDDYYTLGGIPSDSVCQYHVIAWSASYQFEAPVSGMWHLVFANSRVAQEINYEISIYSTEDWNAVQFNNWMLILGCVIVSSIIIIQIWQRKIRGKGIMYRRKNGAAGRI